MPGLMRRNSDSEDDGMNISFVLMFATEFIFEIAYVVINTYKTFLIF